MQNKPLFHVSSAEYGEEAEGVARVLAKRFTQFRFGVSKNGSHKAEPFIQVVDFLKASYPPPAKRPATGQ